MKKLLIALSGALAYLLVSLVLTSYDHKVTHMKLNGAVTKEFSERYFASLDKESTFYYYNFLFSGSGALEGEEVKKGGLLEIETGTASKNVQAWIEHGGMSADEPQLPASFVHFYDPTQPEGQRYLKDLLDDFYVSWALENPKTDHVEWAISDDRNEYNYEAAKKHFKNALEQPDESYRKMNMAFAWRAFGQTLHLIADMGIASHVRDDAHPGVGSGATGYKWSFDADPYEEIVFLHASQKGIESFLGGNVDPAVETFARSAKTVKSIAEQLAAYTNKNFFSHETISGTGVIPKIHPEKTYPAPKLDDCTYNSSTNIYTKTIGGNTVKMCKDLSYLAVLNGFRGYPYIDEECTLSQATALMPQIREAGVNALRLFIPKIEIKITALGDDFIEGEVKHKTDEEYPEEILYNGKVSIKKASNLDLIDEVTCENGVFRDAIDLTGFNRTFEQLFAEIECGYVYIKSEPFVETPPPKWNYLKVNMDNIDGIYKLTQNTGEKQSEKTLDWTYSNEYYFGRFVDGVFTLHKDTVIGGWRYITDCTLHIDIQKKIITEGSFSAEVSSFYEPEKRFKRIHFDVANIAANGWAMNYGSFGLGGQDVCNPQKLFNLTRIDYDDYGNNYFFKWELISYNCRDLSGVSFRFREEEW